jgi:hypothetical protein
MTTRMHHPEHGWTHAYGDAEVAAHEANGWVVEKLTIPGERAVIGNFASASAVGRPVPDVVQFYAEPKRKPGRPRKAK